MEQREASKGIVRKMKGRIGAAFAAAALLTARVISEGSILALNELFFVDSLNVFLVTLTALVAFTTSLFSRP
jgi:hydrogenase-4 component F